MPDVTFDFLKHDVFEFVFQLSTSLFDRYFIAIPCFELIGHFKALDSLERVAFVALVTIQFHTGIAFSWSDAGITFEMPLKSPKTLCL